MINRKLYIKTLAENISQKILAHIKVVRYKSNNIWYFLNVVLVCILTTVWFYFFFINPYILKSQMSNGAASKESDIMYVLHQVSPNSAVKHFEVIPIIAGDRIFIVQYDITDTSNSYTNIKKVFSSLGWIDEYGHTLKKNNLTAIVKSVDENTLQIMIASIETRWGAIRLEASKIYQ